MTVLKKQEIAIYTTTGVCLLLMGVVTGAWAELLKMLAVAGIIMFTAYTIYSLIYKLIDRVYPNKTITKGGNTLTVEYTCENRN